MVSQYLWRPFLRRQGGDGWFLRSAGWIVPTARAISNKPLAGFLESSGQASASPPRKRCYTSLTRPRWPRRTRRRVTLGFVLIDGGSGQEHESTRLYSTIAAGLLVLIGWGAASLLPASASLAIILSAVLVGGLPIFRAALGAARRRMLTVDILVSLAVTAAVLSGEALAAAQVVVLMSVGELLEERTVARSRRAVRQLLDLAPKTVTLLRDGREVTVPREQVVEGDQVVVRPGGRVPVDGTVVAGRADVSEAPVTGESRLIAKGPGDHLFAGSLAQDGTLTLRADHVGPDTTLARIGAMIEEAQARQAPVARQVDRFAAAFIPISLLAALLVLLVTRETERAVTILIGACPCALVLSTPVAVYAAIGGGIPAWPAGQGRTLS